MKYLATKAEFDQQLIDAGDKTIVIDYTATWCPPCKAIAPKYEAMEAEFPNVIFTKIDVDENQETAEFVEIKCMPTFQFWKNGKQIEEDKIEGASEPKLRQNLTKHK